ncbi:hypothetical protein HYZ82_02340 [Candidatus Nomurabacteria bacterium]|nr:hypothetical protein [Candidatus Nomurabacteria bacterium]
MITPELLSYIRGELGKGRTREEVRADLVKGGGWKEEDLSEAFRIVMPMQGFFAPTSPSQNNQSSPNESPVHRVSSVSSESGTKSSKKFIKILIFVILILAVVAGSYFYRREISNLWGKTMAGLSDFSMPSFDFKKITGIFGGRDREEASAVNENKGAIPAAPAVPATRDCGTSVSPDLRDTSTYQNSVLNCLGNSAISCTPAEAVLTDALFPTDFEILRKNIGEETTCNFKLSYAADSVLVDPTGSKLAGQYVMCPLSVVKMIDEKNKTLSFKAPDTSNPSLYAGQIYFYGTLGLFMEQDVDKSKILSLGCSGPYIDSVIASYKAGSN